MKKIIFIIIVLGLSVNFFPQTKVGTTVGNFLTIPVGPRATGMGGAFSAVANDANAVDSQQRGAAEIAVVVFFVHAPQGGLGPRFTESHA